MKRKSIETESADGLRASGLHEAAHAIACFHYGVPIGDEGVWIDDTGHGSCHNMSSEKYGKRDDASREQWQEYCVGAVIGSVAEFRHRNLSYTQLEDTDILYAWLGDFDAALCMDTENNDDDDDDDDLFFFALDCFRMLTQSQHRGSKAMNEEAELVIQHPKFGNIGHDLKEAMLTADKLVTTYADDIRAFAELLVIKGKVTKKECAEWAQKFQHKVQATADVAVAGQ